RRRWVSCDAGRRDSIARLPDSTPISWYGLEFYLLLSSGLAGCCGFSIVVAVAAAWEDRIRLSHLRFYHGRRSIGKIRDPLRTPQGERGFRLLHCTASIWRTSLEW
ncbi:unnamed protein product, partial [Musa acuminata subsp. burmannicoides]